MRGLEGRSCGLPNVVSPLDAELTQFFNWAKRVCSKMQMYPLGYPASQEQGVPSVSDIEAYAKGIALVM
nr:hypothetical protein [Pseudomonas triclosanedens]